MSNEVPEEINKPISLPESIRNEVTHLLNEMDDHDKEIRYIKSKKTLAHAKMWGLINDKVPETRGVACVLNQNKEIVFTKTSPLGDLFGKLFDGGPF